MGLVSPRLECVGCGVAREGPCAGAVASVALPGTAPMLAGQAGQAASPAYSGMYGKLGAQECFFRRKPS